MPSSIRFVGTGTAFHQDARGSQCLLIDPPVGGALMVDIGPTSLERMEGGGVDYVGLERLFVTHLHGDHMGGWPFLLLNLSMLYRRTTTLHVHGPVGTRDCLETLAEVSYGAPLAAERLGFEVHYHELEVRASNEVAAGELRFDALPMEHHSTSLGYRFHLADGVVAVTGDTGWCPGLEQLADGSDLLIAECTTARPTELPHLSLDELRRSISRLDARRVALVHLTDEVAAELAADPIERVLAAHDGMLLELS